MKIMTYETSNTAPRYSTKININEPHDVKYWAREFEISSGAGFVVPLLGDVMRMPGLPAVPNAERIDIDNNGVITGLS